MDLKEKADIMIKKLKERGVLPAENLIPKLQEALIESQRDIIRFEADLKNKELGKVGFPVELRKEGFCFWSYGGYNEMLDRGQAVTAAGHDGRPLEVRKHLPERIGKHDLLLIYPGCFIAKAKTVKNGDTCIDVYQVLNFYGLPGGGFETRCQLLYSAGPGYAVSKMAEGTDQILKGLIEMAEAMSMQSNNTRIRYGW